MRRLKIALVWLIVGAVIGAPVALAIIGMAPSHPAGYFSPTTQSQQTMRHSATSGRKSSGSGYDLGVTP
jgi:hypothetical protein